MTDSTAAATAPAANPAALGLVGFGMTTLLLSSINAGLLPAGGEGVVIPMALAYGGLIQLIAGLLEFKLGNTFGMTAFLSYGAFWWWFALLVFWGGNKALDLSGADSAIGFTLVLWGLFTLGLWVSTFHLTRLLFCIFLTLWIAFFLLGFGAMLGNPMLHQLGGWVGLLCGAMAMYGSFAIVTNTTVGREVVPVGSRK